MGFVGWLQLLFIALKLTGVLEWGWLIILAPSWGAGVLAFVVCLIVGYFKAREDARAEAARFGR